MATHQSIPEASLDIPSSDIKDLTLGRMTSKTLSDMSLLDLSSELSFNGNDHAKHIYKHLSAFKYPFWRIDRDKLQTLFTDMIKDNMHRQNRGIGGYLTMLIVYLIINDRKDTNLQSVLLLFQSILLFTLHCPLHSLTTLPSLPPLSTLWPLLLPLPLFSLLLPTLLSLSSPLFPPLSTPLSPLILWSIPWQYVHIVSSIHYTPNTILSALISTVCLLTGLLYLDIDIRYIPLCFIPGDILTILTGNRIQTEDKNTRTQSLWNLCKAWTKQTLCVYTEHLGLELTTLFLCLYANTDALAAYAVVYAIQGCASMVGRSCALGLEDRLATLIGLGRYTHAKNYFLFAIVATGILGIVCAIPLQVMQYVLGTVLARSSEEMNKYFLTMLSISTVGIPARLLSASAQVGLRAVGKSSYFTKLNVLLTLWNSLLGATILYFSLSPTILLALVTALSLEITVMGLIEAYKRSPWDKELRKCSELHLSTSLLTEEEEEGADRARLDCFLRELQPVQVKR